jgi:hypothetical protein
MSNTNNQIKQKLQEVEHDRKVRAWNPETSVRPPQLIQKPASGSMKNSEAMAKYHNWK